MKLWDIANQLDVTVSTIWVWLRRPPGKHRGGARTAA